METHPPSPERTIAGTRR